MKNIVDPKFRLKQYVSVNGQGKFEVLEKDVHGAGYCDCCKSPKSYWMYRLSAHGWYNEDQLQTFTGN